MPLGNGFRHRMRPRQTALVGGGIGVPPLYGLAEALVDKGIVPKVITGFNSKSDIILTREFRALSIEPVITTADGSYGIKGFVTDAMKDMDFDYVYTCGPEPMLKAVYDCTPDGQFSFEARMACGFGACIGAPAKPNTVINASAKTVLYYIRRKSNGRSESQFKWHHFGQSCDSGKRYLRIRQRNSLKFMISIFWDRFPSKEPPEKQDWETPCRALPNVRTV